MARARRPETEQEEGPPRRRWGRALLWLAVIVIVAVAVLAVSFAADDRTDPLAQEPNDVAALCAAAEPFDTFNRLDLDATGVDRLRSLQSAASELAALSPAPIAADFAAVENALGNVAAVVESLAPDDPNALTRVTESFAIELGTIAPQADEAAAYIDRWCAPVTTEPG